MFDPLLSNFDYDRVLRDALPPGLSVTYYADDILLLIRGDSWTEVAALATIGATHLIPENGEIGTAGGPRQDGGPLIS